MADDAEQLMSDSNYAPTDDEPKAEPEPEAEEAKTTDNYTTTSEPQAEPDGNYEEPAPSAPGAGDYEAKEANIELQNLSKQYSSDVHAAGSMLAGQYIELEHGDKIINFRVKSVGEVRKDTTSAGATLFGSGGGGEILQERTKTIEEERAEQIGDLVPESTNAWLYIAEQDENEQEEDEDKGCMESCSENATNKFIAVFVIILQIAAYIAMTVFLMKARNEEFESQQKACHGQFCTQPQDHCMTFGTGGLTSVLLVGFLWADVVNTCFLIGRSWHWAIASIAVLSELFCAIICGFLVGVYSESDFDAIGGAVGILFVHDLDEKVYASMQVFRGQKCQTFKKVLAISFWIILSLAVALGVSCKYQDGSMFGTCKDSEFACENGDCIWEGFQCNGIEDCSDSSDEGTSAGCNYALYTKCDNGTFLCVENGACIEGNKRCNGVLDCPLGSDEGRNQNCSEVIKKKKCTDSQFNVTFKYPENNDTYRKAWSGIFKCNNGQCINAAYACDGIKGDCVDGSDEYPDFAKPLEWPFEKTCPYAQLVECEDGKVLCKVNGQCITKDQICDGAQDCPDGGDEVGCDYNCAGKIKQLKSFQCGSNVVYINKTHWIKKYALTDQTNLTVAGQNTFAWNNTKTNRNNDAYPATAGFTANIEKCIPVQWRCDGTNDCEDGTDEEFCSLFTCESEEYQCTDTGKCLSKDWLCDGAPDCENGEDEQKSVCKANGVTIGDDCNAALGEIYKCDGFDICLYSYNMCDGYQDCPYADDEDSDNCEAAFSAATSSTTTFVPGGSGSVDCTTGTKTGTGTEFKLYSYTFTMPSSGYTYLKITNCLSENQGDADLALCPYDDLANGDYSTCIYPYTDYACSGCNYRTTISAATNGMAEFSVTAGTKYVIGTQIYFSGTYAFKVECLNAVGSYGGTCTDSKFSSGGGGFSTTGGYPGYGTTYGGGGGSGATSGGGGGSGTTYGGGGGSGTTGGTLPSGFVPP